MVASRALAATYLWTASSALAAASAGGPAGWIWSTAGAEAAAANGTVGFRLSFELSEVPTTAGVLVSADNSFQLFVNGTPAASGGQWQEPLRQEVVGALRAGHNVICIQATNTGGPAGLYVEGTAEYPGGSVDLGSGPAWRCAEKPPSGWTRADFDSSAWSAAVVLGPRDMAPWHFEKTLSRLRTAPPILPPTDWAAFRQERLASFEKLPKPAAPPGDQSGHPVDRFLLSWWATAGVSASATCDDAAFARRAYLDAIGMTPTEQELRQFLGDGRADKRERLVEALLDDDLAYAEGWMGWWCDLLRNDEQTSIDGLRKPITPWLFAALRENRPYDRMVTELLNPAPGGPDGYLKGINWRGIVNASQLPPVQAAQNVGQVFLATNIKCASCHDHFTRPYLLEDAYGLASFFSEKNLEIYRCDKPTGEVKAPEFLLHDVDLGSVAPDADLPTRLRAVAGMVTDPRNPRFARTMVNRLWKRLMGRGLFEPVDDFDAKPANPELLDWLAWEFMRSGYDLKHMVRLLMTSRAYQLVAVVETADEMRVRDKESPVFTGPPLRRLSSEQFLDSFSRLTGHWPAVDTMRVEVAAGHVRAWRHRVPDALARALGRPNREQVTTVRVEDASMLQMLEMTNGRVMAERLSAGAKALLAEVGDETPGEALTIVYLRAYAREPSPQERALLEPLLAADGAEACDAAWEDVLWMMVMSPEYQFIR